MNYTYRTEQKGKTMSNPYQLPDSSGPDIEVMTSQIDKEESELDITRKLAKSTKRAGWVVNLVYAPIWFATAIASTSIWPFLLVSLFGIAFLFGSVIVNMAMKHSITEQEHKIKDLKKARNRALLLEEGINPYIADQE